MSKIQVTNRFELHGGDPRELARRVTMLRQAVRAQKGTVLNVEWSRLTPTGAPKASVVYQIPLARLHVSAGGASESQ